MFWIVVSNMNGVYPETVIEDVKTVGDALLDNKDTDDKGEDYFGGCISEGTNRFGYYGIQNGNKTVIASLFKKTETINQNDPKLQTSENTYVVVKLYIVNDFVDISTVSFTDCAENARQQTKDVAYDEKGWINGHRLKDISTAVRDLFQSM